MNHSTLRLVALNYLNIPSTGLQQILEILAEVEFVKLQTEGRSIKTVVPTVPYYETLYQTLGTFAVDSQFNAAEELSIALLCRLSKSPKKFIHPALEAGVNSKLFKRAFELGKEGAYLRLPRSRGRDIALSPIYFSENARHKTPGFDISRSGVSKIEARLRFVDDKDLMFLAEVLRVPIQELFPRRESAGRLFDFMEKLQTTRF